MSNNPNLIWNSQLREPDQPLTNTPSKFPLVHPLFMNSAYEVNEIALLSSIAIVFCAI